MAAEVKPALCGKQRARIRLEVAERFVQDRSTVFELADQIGRRPGVVRRLLDEAGIREAGRSLIGTDEQETARSLARRYTEGASIAALVRATGLDKRAIRAMLVSQGVALPGRHSLTGDELHQVEALYQAGDSIRELAVSYGSSYGTVRSALLALGVKLRPKGYHAVGRPVSGVPASG
jgi:hypothetical protein